jgi:hypothetical protein
MLCSEDRSLVARARAGATLTTAETQRLAALLEHAVSQEMIGALVQSFVNGDNPDAEHEVLARDIGGSGRYAVVTWDILSSEAERQEVEKFVRWYVQQERD